MVIFIEKLEDAVKSLEKTIQTGLNFVVDLKPAITVFIVSLKFCF